MDVNGVVESIFGQPPPQEAKPRTLYHWTLIENNSRVLFVVWDEGSDDILGARFLTKYKLRKLVNSYGLQNN